jgi:TPR repeat protein
MMDYIGGGVPQDDVRAYMWVNLAAAHMTGEEQKQAAENRDDVARRMTPAQIAEAKQLARQCRSKKFKGC